LYLKATGRGGFYNGIQMYDHPAYGPQAIFREADNDNVTAALTAGGPSGDPTFRMSNLSGTTKFFVDSENEKVGIGTDSPAHNFHVVGDAIISGYLYDSTNSTGVDGYVLTSKENGPQWQQIEDVLSGVGGGGTTNYIPKWDDPDTLGDSVIAQSGVSIGIGTASPQYKLDVAGTINSSSAIYAADVVVNGTTPTITLNDTDGDANAATAFIQFQQGGTAIGKVGDIASGRSAMMLYADSGKELMLFTNGQNATSDTPAITINTSQNVGIGTTSPNAKLEISGDTRSGGRILYGGTESNYLTGVSYASIYGTADTFESVSGLFGSLVLQSRSNTDRPIIFVTGATPSEKMRLSSSGSLGIGTTNPSSKLHIVNSANSAFLVNTGAGTGYTYLKSTNTGGEFLLGINRSDGVLFSSGLAYATSLGTTGSTALQFHTNNSPRVTVDTSLSYRLLVVISE
jgi:hypothetical protein